MPKLPMQVLGLAQQTTSRVPFESIPGIDRDGERSSDYEVAELDDDCSLTLNTSGNSLKPKEKTGLVEPHSGMPAENLNSGISPMPVAPIASHRGLLQKNKGKTTTEVRRARSNFPVLYEHCQDLLTPVILNPEVADRSSSYNHLARNSLQLSSVRSEEFDNEFS